MSGEQLEWSLSAPVHSDFPLKMPVGLINSTRTSMTKETANL